MTDPQQFLSHEEPPARRMQVAPPSQPQQPRSGWDRMKTILLFAVSGPALISFLFFLWATVGEYFISSEEYRFSTYIGRRMGDIEKNRILRSIEAEVEKQKALLRETADAEVEKQLKIIRQTALATAQKEAAVDASKGVVQLQMNCRQTNYQMAQQAFTQCIAQGGLQGGCEQQRDAIMNQPCMEVTPGELTDDYNRITGAQ